MRYFWYSWEILDSYGERHFGSNTFKTSGAIPFANLTQCLSDRFKVKEGAQILSLTPIMEQDYISFSDVTVATVNGCAEIEKNYGQKD